MKLMQTSTPSTRGCVNMYQKLKKGDVCVHNLAFRLFRNIDPAVAVFHFFFAWEGL